jgi:predicted Zn-dependent protease
MRSFIVAATTAVALSLAVQGAHAMGSNSSTPASGPTTAELYEKAVKEVEAKEFRAAVETLNKVIEEKPKHPDALNYLGYSHRKLGDYAKAVSYYKRALSLEPAHKGANEYLGEAYVELGDLKSATERLDALDKICGTDCKEYKALKAAIDAAKAKGAAKQG